MAPMAACDCDAKEQKVEHILTSFPIYHHPNEAHTFSDVKKKLVAWLMETCPAT